MLLTRNGPYPEFRVAEHERETLTVQALL
jgi:hypothetical protein